MATEHSAFAASGEDAINRALDVHADTTADNLSSSDFEDFYEISRTVEEIVKGDYKRIALQFPDELLHVSVPIYRRLKASTGEGREFYVLADTSYGRQALAITEAFSAFGIKTLYQKIPTKTIPVIGIMKDTFPSQPHNSQNNSHSPASLQASEIPADSSNPALLYIGGESLTLTNLLMTHGLSDVFSYDPSTNITGLASGRSNRLLMRRYAAIQHARDADVFGILVGTLGVSSYLTLIRHIRALLKRHRKKSYTISVGKLNPSKLANFLEIECFVFVACPENSVIEAKVKEFLRPIITPFELEVALQSTPKWTGRYVLNFETLLAEAQERTAKDKVKATTENGVEEESEDDAQDPDRPVFSLVTGTYRQAKRYSANENRLLDGASGPDSAVVLRNQDSTVARLADTAAAMFLQTRTYQGLETRVGEDAPSVLEQGRSGIARGYRDVDHKVGAVE
ncbi:hypothetical protein C0995_001003 [Termitomyces sp. Mi166|nr:hypothetical protein C0995_001003 [Termitomyces sp. Mi166\